jgi:hypothetical protein
MAFENDKFTCLLPNESNEKKKARKTVQEYVELLKPFKRCLYYASIHFINKLYVIFH